MRRMTWFFEPAVQLTNGRKRYQGYEPSIYLAIFPLNESPEFPARWASLTDLDTSDWRLQIQVSPGSDSPTIKAKRKAAQAAAEAKRAEEAATREAAKNADLDEM